MKRRITQDQLKITGFYKSLKCLTINYSIPTSFDPGNRMFVNVNTPDDLARLQARRT
jgi:molybdopterin-guanine dinucleotide biosynthesis protein A